MKVNVFSVNEARWAVEAGKGRHKSPHIVDFKTEDFVESAKKIGASSLIVPSVESDLAIKQIDNKR